jgi:flagellar motor switch protein FliG
MVTIKTVDGVVVEKEDGGMRSLTPPTAQAMITCLNLMAHQQVRDYDAVLHRIAVLLSHLPVAEAAMLLALLNDTLDDFASPAES